ncbi:hypothetical protein PV328_011724 [Microctonus aethiopoides]|uniref:Uncharacterized protein n=1 Tax=Microctonus aethiopoides TaxID=144406 RepID=A0AA39C3G8_9HYME|nr:hypothetical protein PV328_011724 [Microctonus aethiopoides]
MESDHMPLEFKIYGTRADKEEEYVERWEERRVWDEDGIKTYHQRCEKWQDENEEVNKKWENIKNKVKEAIPTKKVKIRTWKIGEREWHDSEWKKRKRDARKLVRDWRKNKCSREDLIKKKKEYRRWQEERKKEYEDEKMREIECVKTEQEVWKFINKYRKKKGKNR